jgi:Phage integrase, N-terminal SAM-like domain
MASWPKPEVRTPPERSCPTLVSPITVEIQSIGPSLPRVGAPEGWVKKVERAREGKVWVGYFHVWETALDGQRVRRKKEKTLGPATRPKHEALNDLAEYIAEHTGKLAKQGESISTFAELWKAFCAVKSGQWSKKTRENLKCLFAKHVIPQIGTQRMRDVTLTPLQLLVNKLAEDGFSKSVVGQIRTYVKTCFEYAVDEDLIPKSPAHKLVMPKIRKKPCERFLSVGEFRALLSDAPPREHVILRIFAVCGLRPCRGSGPAHRGFRGCRTPNR